MQTLDRNTKLMYLLQYRSRIREKEENGKKTNKQANKQTKTKPTRLSSAFFLNLSWSMMEKLLRDLSSTGGKRQRLVLVLAKLSKSYQASGVYG